MIRYHYYVDKRGNIYDSEGRLVTKDWTCKCGATSVTKSGTTATVTGKGWIKGQPSSHIVCHECHDRIQIGYKVVFDNRVAQERIKSELHSKASTSTKSNGKGDVEFYDTLPGEEA